MGIAEADHVIAKLGQLGTALTLRCGVEVVGLRIHHRRAGLKPCNRLAHRKIGRQTIKMHRHRRQNKGAHALMGNAQARDCPIARRVVGGGLEPHDQFIRFKPRFINRWQTTWRCLHDHGWCARRRLPWLGLLRHRRRLPGLCLLGCGRRCRRRGRTWRCSLWGGFGGLRCLLGLFPCPTAFARMRRYHGGAKRKNSQQDAGQPNCVQFDF